MDKTTTFLCNVPQWGTADVNISVSSAERAHSYQSSFSNPHTYRGLPQTYQTETHGLIIDNQKKLLTIFVPSRSQAEHSDSLTKKESEVWWLVYTVLASAMVKA